MMIRWKICNTSNAAYCLWHWFMNVYYYYYIIILFCNLFILTGNHFFTLGTTFILRLCSFITVRFSAKLWLEINLFFIFILNPKGSQFEKNCSFLATSLPFQNLSLFFAELIFSRFVLFKLIYLNLYGR